MRGMDIAVVGIVGLFLGAALLVWWVLVLIEALRTPKAQWDAAGQSQILYVALMVFLGVVGTISYIVVARPLLRGVDGMSA